jgi:hypothetical protein
LEDEGESSLGSSPSKKPAPRERGSSAENISCGEGSLLEFERLEMELQAKQKNGAAETEEDGKPRSPSSDEDKLFLAVNKGTGSISGSVGSLTEFENIERELQDQGKNGDEIMILR